MVVSKSRECCALGLSYTHYEKREILKSSVPYAIMVKAVGSFTGPLETQAGHIGRDNLAEIPFTFRKIL